MQKPKAYMLRFNGESWAQAALSHDRPFNSVSEAIKEANAFNQPGRRYSIYNVITGKIVKTGVVI